MLRLLGIDHTRLMVKFQGRDFRLTDVSGRIIEKLLAWIPAFFGPHRSVVPILRFQASCSNTAPAALGI